MVSSLNAVPNPEGTLNSADPSPKYFVALIIPLEAYAVMAAPTKTFPLVDVTPDTTASVRLPIPLNLEAVITPEILAAP